MTGIFWAILSFLSFLSMATLADMVSEEVRDRLDHLPHAILRLAARRLDPAQRITIYEDEWLPELTYILSGAETRPITRLITGTRYALGILITASRIARNLHRASPDAARAQESGQGRADASQRELGYRGGRGPLVRAGDALIFLTSADRTKIGSASERNRYITIGLLMLVTAAQAFYSASLFFSMGLGKPFFQEMVFGAFFAIAVYLIDRSIIGYVAPPRLDKNGDLKPLRKAAWTSAIKIMIALAATMLVSEIILLQVFAGDIRMQVQVDHLTQFQQARSQIYDTYQERIIALQQPTSQAQAVVNSLQQKVRKDYSAVNCQEFGCPGIPAGIGPGYRSAQNTLAAAMQELDNATTQLQTIRQADNRQIAALETQEQQATDAAKSQINHADSVLSSEEALWQLTTRNENILVVRILMSLLIFGINLAPVLTKLTGRTTMHDMDVYHSNYTEIVKEQHQIQQQMRRMQMRQAEIQLRRMQIQQPKKIRHRPRTPTRQRDAHACGRYAPCSRPDPPSCLRGCARSAPPPWS